MKKTILSVIIGLACALSAVADEYGYLKGTNTVTLAEGEQLIILSMIRGSVNSSWTGKIVIEFPPEWIDPELGGNNIYSVEIGRDSDLAHRTFIGPCEIRAATTDRDIFAYKKTSTGVFTNPMNVVMLPADNNGDVDLLVETSADLETWTPVYSGSVGTSNSASFIRTRLIQN